MAVNNPRHSVVFDAYAWVEYALDGPQANVVNMELDSATEAFTPASVIAELKESMMRHKISTKTISSIINFVKGKSLVVQIDSTVAELAGEINFRHTKRIRDWGMMDSMVYAVAVAKKGKVLTGDPHFKNFSNVVYIGN